MSYNKKVLDHYENPRNVGKMDPDDKKVGTGMVGAPACFAGDTLISMADSTNAKISDLFNAKKDVLVWSYDIKLNKFEINNARPVYSGKKELYEILVEGKSVWVTADHKFLMLNGDYKPNSEIGISESIMPFYRNTRPTDTNHEDQASRPTTQMSISGNKKVEDCYTMQVEQNNNYVVMTGERKNYHSGIVVKNCGDVMRLQIEVSDEGIIEGAVFKTYGCGSAIASSSLLTEWVKGKTLEEAAGIKNSQIAEELSLPP